MKKLKSEFPPIVPSYYNHSSFQLVIQPSHIKQAGLGVFTKVPIPANSFIDFYTGNTYKTLRGSYTFVVRDDFVIDAFDYPRCYMAMINDCYKSPYTHNVTFQVHHDTVEVWSMRDIEAGEELFVDYGKQYWE